MWIVDANVEGILYGHTLQYLLPAKFFARFYGKNVLKLTNLLKWRNLKICSKYQGADKSLARPGRKQAEPIKSVKGRGMGWFG